MKKSRILFVGESWSGSSARSMRESISCNADVVVDDIGEDQHLPRHRLLLLRIVRRFLVRFYRMDLRKEIENKFHTFKPNILLIYKGNGVDCQFLKLAKDAGIFTVNIFPDYSPLVYGSTLRKAMGEYDLVITTKPFHPLIWKEQYGYHNQCVLVPHGYDPNVHLWQTAPSGQDFDLVIAANARPQYVRLMLDVAGAFPDPSFKVGVAGPGWDALRSKLPGHWAFPGPIHGRAYCEWLRRGKIVVAPVNSDVIINGERQPGDEDTTRTYELAAAHCFFLHQRTPFAELLYDRHSEVPMWENSDELIVLIRLYINNESARKDMALAAHKRAVPRYSILSRANDVILNINSAMSNKENYSVNLMNEVFKPYD